MDPGLQKNRFFSIFWSFLPLGPLFLPITSTPVGILPLKMASEPGFGPILGPRTPFIAVTSAQDVFLPLKMASESISDPFSGVSGVIFQF